MIATGWWAGPFIEVENDRVLTHQTLSRWCASLPGLTHPAPSRCCASLPGQRSQSYVSLKGFPAALPTEGRVQGKRLRSNRWVGRVENARRGPVGGEADRFDHPYGGN